MLMFFKTSRVDSTEFHDTLIVHPRYPSFLFGLLGCILCSHDDDGRKYLLID